MKLNVALALSTAVLAGCVGGAPPARPDALVIASCPELPPVNLVTPADSYRLHVEDARRYNVCRCAALAHTSVPCRAETADPVPAGVPVPQP